jgi:hypothetical protein
MDQIGGSDQQARSRGLLLQLIRSYPNLADLIQ